MNQKYIVKDINGDYQAAYNLSLGQKKALEWAIQCAKSVTGATVYLVNEDTNEEKLVYPTT